MKLYTRPGSPRLYADLTHPGTGKRVRVSTGETEQRAARKVALSRMAEMQREAEVVREAANGITIGAALGRYTSAVAGKASAAKLHTMAAKLTGTHPGMAGRWHLNPARWLHDLTLADLDDLVAARRDEGNGAQTVKHELATLRAATRHAARLGFKAPEALSGAGARNAWRIPEVAHKTRYLSLEEYGRVFAYLDPMRPVETTNRYGAPAAAYVPIGKRKAARQDVQDLLLALAMTGGRWNEVQRLTWPQVDLSKSLIRICAMRGKERLAPLPGPAKAMLERRYAARNLAEPVVFPGAGGGFRDPSSCKPILRAMDVCGLNDLETVERHGRATVHSLRHTFASLLLQNGADLSEVQEALGYTSLHMTRRYAHPSKHESASRLGTILTRVASGDGPV